MKFGDELRRVRCCEELPSAGAIWAAVAKLFAVPPESVQRFHLTYYDDEGDACTLTDATFQDFVCLSSKTRVLRLSVSERATPADVASEEQITDEGSSVTPRGTQPEISPPSTERDTVLADLKRRAKCIRDDIEAGVGRIRGDLEAELDEFREKIGCIRTDLRAGVESARAGFSNGVDRLHSNASQKAGELSTDFRELKRSAEDLIGSDAGSSMGKAAALSVGGLAAARVARGPVGFGVAAGAIIAGSVYAAYGAASHMLGPGEPSDGPVQYSSYVSAYYDESDSAGLMTAGDNPAEVRTAEHDASEAVTRT